MRDILKSRLQSSFLLIALMVVGVSATLLHPLGVSRFFSNLASIEMVKLGMSCKADSCDGIGPEAVTTESYLRQAHSLSHLDCNVNRMNAQLAIWQGKYVQALEGLEAVMQICPSDDLSGFFLGQTYAALGRPDQALSTWQSIGPDLGWYFLWRGDSYKRGGRLLEAEDAYLTAVALNPDLPYAYYGLSGIYWGDPEKAIWALQQAMETDKGAPDRVMSASAKIHFLKGEWAEATRGFGFVIEANPADPWAHFFRAVALEHLEDPVGARLGFVGVLQADSTFGQAYLHLGRSAMLRGDFQYAIVLFTEARQFDPRLTAEALVWTSAVYVELGRWEDAERCLEAAIGLAPTNVDYLLGLAVVYERAGRFDDAADVYERIIQMDPVNEDAVGALRRLEGKEE